MPSDDHLCVPFVYPWPPGIYSTHDGYGFTHGNQDYKQVLCVSVVQCSVRVPDDPSQKGSVQSVITTTVTHIVAISSLSPGTEG